MQGNVGKKNKNDKCLITDYYLRFEVNEERNIKRTLKIVCV